MNPRTKNNLIGFAAGVIAGAVDPERQEAIARLNARQQKCNVYTNIGETEIEREISRHKGRNRSQ